MIIHSIKDYSIVVEMDVVQAAALMQLAHIALEMGLDEEVAERMQLLGTEMSQASVVNQAAQVVDSIARAVQMDPFCENCHGDKAGEGLVEEGTTKTEDTKPAKETIN
jgi:hypothetical protein